MSPWLLVPMQPTPNGRLHIGHGGGPYLRADVIARAQRRKGEHASVVTGSDAYENWVLADGFATGRTPEQTCRTFHTRIGEDLKHLGVQLDAWIEPLDPTHQRAYHSIHDQLLTELRRTGRAAQLTEQIPVGADTGRNLLGVWIAGRCPTCQAPAGGNTCTSCGDHFSPEQLLDPHSRLTDEPIRWTQCTNWFAPAGKPEPILHALTATGLADRFLEPVRTYLNRRCARIRLSQPGPWGVPSTQAPADSVLTNTYYAYSLYCAQTAAPLLNNGDNLLHLNSGHTVVGLFGTDNSIAGLLAPHILTANTGFKPFDHTVVSHMLHYQGRKCSTSQQHGIWISDLIANTTVTTDELRYLLASLPLDHAVCDLTDAEVITTINQLRHWKTNVLDPNIQALCRFGSDTAINHQPIITAVHQQQRYLTPPTVDLAAAHTILRGWMHDTTASQATWLIGTALLAAPITPNLAHELWAILGLTGTATLASTVAASEVHPELANVGSIGRELVSKDSINHVTTRRVV